MSRHIGAKLGLVVNFVPDDCTGFSRRSRRCDGKEQTPLPGHYEKPKDLSEISTFFLILFIKQKQNGNASVSLRGSGNSTTKKKIFNTLIAIKLLSNNTKGTANK